MFEWLTELFEYDSISEEQCLFPKDLECPFIISCKECMYNKENR